jgi:hypothetical protein
MRVFIIFLLLLFQNPTQHPGTQKEAQNPQSDEAKAAQVSIVNPSVGSGDKEGPTHNPKYRYPYDAREDCLYRWYMKATIVGVFGGLLGIGVLFWQSLLLRKSTKQTEKAADAAKKSADALMDAEHSVLSIESVQLFDDQMRTMYSMRVWNVGRTIGSFFASNGQLQIGNIDAPPDASVFNYQPKDRRNEMVIAPDSRTPTIFEGIYPAGKFTDDDKRIILARSGYLWACGYFRYRDIFQRVFERRYCYRWEPRGNPEDGIGQNFNVTGYFWETGPPDYNRMIEIK